MATVLLVRHGRTTANASGILAGRALGVELDATGIEQAIRTAERLAVVPLVRVVTSPLERCRRTSGLIVERQRTERPIETVDAGITECDYGDWQGRTLSELSKEGLWSVVQKQPSAATFPGGESMTAMQARAVSSIRGHDAAFEAEFGPQAILADALGMQLDLFQRISVGPASVSIVRFGSDHTEVIATNTDSGDLSWLRASEAAADAPVGGGAGTH
jgi:probable phosphomutase (TIGR03848 family)